MIAAGQKGSIVTLICDPGERYLGSYYDDGWLSEQGLNLTPYLDVIEEFVGSGAN